MKKKIFSSLLLVAVAIASTSMFVSCKDYDDDINKNADAIAALEQTIKTLENQTLPGLYLKIADAERTYATIVAMNQKADKSELANYALKTDLKDWALKSDLNAYALKSELTPLEEWIKDVESAKYLENLLNDLKAFNDENKGGYVKADDEEYLHLVNALAGFDENLASELQKYATQEGVNGRLSPIESALKNVELQEGIVKSYFDKIDELYGDKLTAESKQAIEDLKNGLYLKKSEFDKLPTNLKDFTNDDLAKLKSIMTWYDEKIKEDAGATLNVIQYMLDGRLSSLVFYPEYYLGGIETIEVPVLAYQPIITKVPAARVKDANEENEHFEYAPAAIYGSLQTEDGIADIDPSELYTLGVGKVTFDKAPWSLIGAYAETFNKNKDIKYTYANSELYGTAKYHFNPTTTRLDGMNIQFIDHQPYAIEMLGQANLGENEGENGTNGAKATRIAASKRYVALQKEASNSMIQNGLINVNIGFKDHAAFESYVEQLVKNFDLTVGKNSNFDATGVKYQTNIDVVALQMIKGDTVVTSDYAAVCPTIYHVRHITDIAPQSTWRSDQTVADAEFAKTMPKCDLTAQMQKDYPDMRPLFMQAKNAVADVPTHFVNYKDTFDVRKLIRTHFTYIAPESTLRNEFLHMYEKEIADEDALLAKLGLHYEFFLVDWISGTNVTSESMHMEHLTAAGESKASAENRDPDVKSSLFIARATNGKTGMTSFGEDPEKRYVLDREPLIRIELKNEKGDVIEAGYMKVIISEKVDQISREPIPVVKDFVGPYDMNCSNADSMTWYEFENIVLAAKKDDGSYYLNLNKIEFDKFYQPDFVDAKDGIFARYIKNANGTFSPETVDKRGLMGDVTWKEDLKNKETSVVKFDFGDPENAIKLLGVKENADGTLMLNEKPYETWIRFVDINGVYGDVYLKLSIGEEKLQYIIAEVKNKILSYWYNFNGTDQDQAKESAIPTNIFEDFDVRTNVFTPNVINRPLTTDDWEKDLYEYFYNPKYDEKNITPEGIAHDILDWRLAAKDLKDKDGNDRFDKVSKHGEFILINPFDNGTEKNTNHFASKWEVKGYSGDLYTLRVDEPAKTDDGGYVQNIWAKKGTVEEKIVSLTYTPDKNDKDLVNDEKANLKLLKSEFGYDIMNYVGHSYVTDDNLVFTAYLKVLSPEACYSFVKRPYFNVRFLRPINWYPKGEYVITDAPNKAQIIELNKLISFNDWRTSDNTNEIPYSNFTGKSYVVADQAALFTPGDTPAKEITSYKYYGIKLTSNDKECLTDIHRGEDARTLLTATEVKEALRNIEADVMSENRVRYTGTFTGLDLKYNAATNSYTYQNNKGNVQYFHIYIPLYIQYTFSPWETEHLFIKTWSAVTVNKTVENAKKN